MQTLVIVLLIVGIAAIGLAFFLGRRKDDDTDFTAGRPSPKTRPSSAPASSTTPPQTASNKRTHWFVGESDGVQGKTYHIGARTVTIGRKIGNFIQLTDENSSRVHCRLVPAGDSLQITDLNSAHGTLINGEKLENGAARVLQDMDRVQIGETVFIYYREGDFAVNHGLTDHKNARPDQFKATMGVGSVNWADTLEAELQKAGGDPEAAARNMGLDYQLFRKMLDEAGIQP